MKGVFVLVLLVAISVSWSEIKYQPITGELLNLWNTGNPAAFLTVYHFDTDKLPEGIGELCLAGTEAERDSLDLYLLGIPIKGEIPFLLATGGYRGEYNFAKAQSLYEDGEIHIYFQMPYSARYSEGCYLWDVNSSTLVLTRYIAEDPSLEALRRVDTFLSEGNISAAVDELNSMLYPLNYFNSDEMICRFLRTANRFALLEAEKSNFQASVDIFESLSGYFFGLGTYTVFNDSLDFLESGLSSYMELDEFVMIVNNHAFFLEKTGDFDESLVILRRILALAPHRMVAYLNIADVLWALGEHAEAVEYYTTYLWMMSKNGLSDQVPARVNERTLLEIVSSFDSSAVSFLSEISYPIEMQIYDPARIDSCLPLRHGGIRILLSRFSLSTGFGSFDDNLWKIDIDPDGDLVSFEEVLPENRPILGFPQFGESEDLMLAACTELGDTLWACTFEEQPLEWFHSPDVTELTEGYIVNDPPDCWSTTTNIHRISEDGIVLFNCSLNTLFLLDLQEMEGEIYPGISSFRETESGDILVGGSVSQWVNSPKGCFVCLMDRETGDVLWKMTHFGLGSARVYDAIETSSGSIIAVGITGRHLWPADPETGLWGSTRPFIAVLNSSGQLQQSIVCDMELAGKFISIAELDPEKSEFLIVGVNPGSNQLVFVNAVL